jgi:hypothetical protein
MERSALENCLHHLPASAGDQRLLVGPHDAVWLVHGLDCLMRWTARPPAAAEPAEANFVRSFDSFQPFAVVAPHVWFGLVWVIWFASPGIADGFAALPARDARDAIRPISVKSADERCCLPSPSTSSPSSTVHALVRRLSLCPSFVRAVAVQRWKKSTSVREPERAPRHE